MPSLHRTSADTTGRRREWGLGILVGLIVFLVLPAVGWAMFSSRSSNTGSVSSASDWTPPMVTIVDPGDAIRGTATISATASDGETGVKNVVIAWAPSGTTTFTTLCTDTVSPYSCSFVTTGQLEDYVDFQATATDNSGYVTTYLHEGVLVDNTVPSGALDPIASPMTGVVNLIATAADTGSGVASVVIQRATAGTTTWTTICADADLPYSCRFDTTAMLEGSLLDFRAVVTDIAGNTFTTSLTNSTRNRLVSNTVSSVSVDDPGAYLRGGVTITANANATAGVGSVRIQRQLVGTATWTDLCSDTTSPFSCAWNSTTVADGSYSFRAILTDKLGAQTTSAVVGPAQVDNTAVRGTDVQATSGGSAGKLTAGDTLTLSYSRTMKPSSIIAGWDGSTRAVYVRVRDGLNVGLTTSDDTLDVFTTSAFSTPANLGSVNLKGNHVKNNKTVTFNATIVQNANSVAITLGSVISSAGQLRTVTATTDMVWTPSAAALDTTNIASSTSPVTETGTKDRDF